MSTGDPRRFPDRRPLRLGVLDEPELVITGLSGMLAPHRRRVVLQVLTAPDPGTGVDVVLWDPLRPDGSARPDGRAPAGDEVARLAPARVLVYTWHPTATGLRDALDAGAAGVVSKTSTTSDLLAAVEQAVAVGAVPPGAQRLSAATSGTTYDVPPLSTRELEVLRLICRGLSNKEIAAELFVSVNSVKTYVRQVYQKTGVARRTQAVVWAHRHGIG